MSRAVPGHTTIHWRETRGLGQRSLGLRDDRVARRQAAHRHTRAPPRCRLMLAGLRGGARCPSRPAAPPAPGVHPSRVLSTLPGAPPISVRDRVSTARRPFLFYIFAPIVTRRSRRHQQSSIHSGASAPRAPPSIARDRVRSAAGAAQFRTMRSSMSDSTPGSRPRVLALDRRHGSGASFGASSPSRAASRGALSYQALFSGAYRGRHPVERLPARCV